MDQNVPELILAYIQKLYAPLINQAKQLYREGKYLEARDKLSEYKSISGQTDKELLIMAGYNIVSGVSGLNQFILGIGMFF